MEILLYNINKLSIFVPIQNNLKSSIMNKFFKVLLCSLVTFSAAAVLAQDNPTSLREVSNNPSSVTKKLNLRLYGGPTMDFMTSGDNSVMKGGKLGMNGGLELNKSFGKKSYGIIGIGFASGGFERWINDNTARQKSSFDQITNIELPIGLGFNLGKETPKGFFANFCLINSYTVHSESNVTFIPFGQFEASSNVVNGTYDRFNLGGRAEFGVKTKFEGNSYASFSLAPRVMFYNRFSTNTDQFTGLSIAGLMSFYF